MPSNSSTRQTASCNTMFKRAAALEERLERWLGWAKDTGRYLILENVYAYMPAQTPEEGWTVPENYDYQRNVLKRVTINIQQESRFLILMVTVVTVLFLGMILYARVRQYRHFLYYSRQQEYDGSAESLARQAAARGLHRPAHLKHRKKKGED